MRIFKDCEQMIKEIDRELAVCGITVPVKHYQNVQLEGEDQNTKELIGVSFLISKPLLGRTEMIEFLFKDESKRILEYCVQEHADRTSGKAFNPGNSYKIRIDLWQGLMAKKDKEKFDYTYAERMSGYEAPQANQIDNCVKALEEDIHSRRAMLLIWDLLNDTQEITGANTRVPCSISYQFLIRNNRLYCIYYIRSNDYFKHFAIDIWQAAEMIKYMVNRLQPKYPDLKPGSLTYFAGSLHAYNEDLKKWVIY
ncbi:thymidylate synthase [Candidatus Woesearchaeota archaeon]|nr:thymidylate synthase [Candidatus Woesearchaeota archaeon]